MRKIIEFVWKRHQGHWNWFFMAGSMVVFFMALWTHSIILFIVSAAFFGAALLELPDPEPRFVRIDRLLKVERKWLNSRWTLKKWFQAFGIFAAVVYLGFVFWENSILGILLFVGICAGIACVYGNKAMGVDEL